MVLFLRGFLERLEVLTTPDQRTSNSSFVFPLDKRKGRLVFTSFLYETDGIYRFT